MKTQALLCVVTITGLWTVSLCLSHQYHLVNDQMNWTDAQQYCRDKFTDLATIHTLEDVDTLTSTLDSQTTVVWIGLYNDVTSWRWSLADQRFYQDAEEHTFRNWAPDQPNHKLCAVMHGRNGLWTAASCGRGCFSICFDNNTDQTKKYVRIAKPLPWIKAQSLCREKHTDLASVRNQAELQEIHKAVGSLDFAWIGLHRHSWKWSDGSSSSFRHWIDGKPDGGETGTCAAMWFDKGSKWGDWGCNNKAPFICYGVEKPVLRVKLTINSSLDVSDPAVQDAILEQLKQNVKDHQGAPADIRVRWVKQADGRIFHKEDKKKKKRETKKLTKREL